VAVWGAPRTTGVVSLTGPDARRFCNGMFTNNVRDLPVGGFQRTAMVDDRGRVIGLMALGCEDDARFVAVLEGVSTDDFVERYAKYIVFDDVELEVRTQPVVLTVQGPAAAEVLASAGIEEEPGVRAWRRSRSLPGGFDVWVPLQRVDEVRASLAAHAGEADAPLLRALRVEAGQVAWPDDMAYRQLPHELGLRDALLHFEKGCYIGQESINRIDVMGNLRWGLAVLRLPEVVAAGAELRLGDKQVGRVTSPVALPDGTALALAVLKKPADEPGTELSVHAGAGSQTAVVA
jgi:folate-binding protein YgfZ